MTHLSRLLPRLAAGLVATLLTVAAANAAPLGFGFGINVGPDGQPNVSIGVGTPGYRAPRAPSPVCFYERTRYRGDSFCVEAGSSVRDLNDWTDNIGSFRNDDGLDVTICSRTRLRGSCDTYSDSVRTFDGDASSLRIGRP